MKPVRRQKMRTEKAERMESGKPWKTCSHSGSTWRSIWTILNQHVYRIGGAECILLTSWSAIPKWRVQEPITKDFRFWGPMSNHHFRKLLALTLDMAPPHTVSWCKRSETMQRSRAQQLSPCLKDILPGRCQTFGKLLMFARLDLTRCSKVASGSLTCATSEVAQSKRFCRKAWDAFGGKCGKTWRQGLQKPLTAWPQLGVPQGKLSSARPQLMLQEVNQDNQDNQDNQEAKVKGLK